MGSFYGNITNTSKTQFQFDKIYPNRYEMERQKSTDGIYAGRYVLVEYDSAYQQDDSYRVWIFENKLYNTNKKDDSYLIYRSAKETIENKKLSSVPAGTIVFTADNKISSSTGYYYTNVKYYQITEDNPIGQAASFKEIVNGLDIPNYTINYNVDVSTYGAGRGYDSTVWQKAYIDGYEKYIMIAELNSVVPTFDVSADAPTMDPLIPHFDTQSTDIYYKLHWQPSWGFRVAEGETDSRKTESEDNDAGSYPSDINVSYNKNSYDASTGKNTTTKISYPGAIFFNSAGLDETTHNEYDGKFKNTNEISIKPTGLSGNKYNTHDGSLNVEKAPDIQEIKVLLPALGNILCNVWDKVYGYDPNNDNQRYRDTQWKDARTGKKFEGEIVSQPDNLGEKDLGYMTRNSETIAGCINLVHDLLGMILVNGDVSLNEITYNTKRIYYRNGGYYRIYKYPLYEKVDISAVTSLNPGDFDSDQEYNTNFEIAVNDILKAYPDEDWYLVISEDDDNWQVKRFNKKALTNESLNGKALAHIKRSPDGSIQYGYKWQEIKGFASDLSTINGLILELRNLIESDDSETRNRETIQGTINTLNDIINIFEDLVPGEFLICDANGHVNSANWTTAQDYSYNNIGNSNSSLAESKEDQWIKVSLDESNRLIHITHQAHSEEDTRTELDVNRDGALTDNIDLYTPIVDNMGHIVGKNTQTVTLPFGFKFIQPNTDASGNVKDATSNTDIIKANTCHDTLQVRNSNKWLKVSADADQKILYIGHKTSEFADEAKANKYYGLEQNETVASLDEDDNTFEVPCIKFDEAGHVIGARTHTVVLPDNFTKVKVTISTQQDTLGASKSDTIEADTMTDTLIFAEGDHWINLAADKVNDKVTIYHAAPGTQTSTTITGKEEPNFGATIQIPEVKYDKTGHITSVSTHTAKIPLPSLNDITADEASVLTGLSMEDTTGVITQTNAKVGTLKLTGYSKGTTNEAVADTDSINQAFGKLQAHIENTDANLNTEVAARETAINTEIIKRNSAITEAIEALDVKGDTLTADKTIKSWNEVDGKISITPQPIMIANANVATDAAIDISKISIGDDAIAMGKINGLISALEGKQPAGKYEISGAATAVQNSLIGTDKDTATTLTLNGLLARIKALEDRVTTLEGNSGV